MKKKYVLKIVLLFTWLFFGCQTTSKIINDSSLNLRFDIPENIWLSNTAKLRVDSVFSMSEHAHNALVNKDTLGAELTYEVIFETLSRFTEEEQETLLIWSEYDSTLKLINTNYDIIFVKSEETLEAEEIREDISEMEDILFPDSVLFGHETVIDSSGSMPLTLNSKVRAAIKYFQTTGRNIYTKWLERSGKYEGLISNILSEYDLPQDLIYLAMIESGFNPSARSYARAAGMWQFISATGKYYGLRHDWWFDERRDYVKATVAAAEHLRDLNKRFHGNWYLALAGYNCNPKRVEKNMRKYNTNDYWKLHKLPRQTQNYVPTYLAATIIAKDPKKFGFYVKKQKPLEVDSVNVSESIDLNVVATSVDTTYDYIKEINPAVLQWVTPPSVQNFTLYLPKGKKEQFKAVYAQMPDGEKRSWVRHKIRSGETLSYISQKYHTSISVLKATNKLYGNTIRAGHYLIIPVPQNEKHFYVSNYSNSASLKESKKKTTSKVKENSVEYKSVKYKVKKGDTLGGIAEFFSTKASKIRSWNGLYYGQHIYPNQILTLFVQKNESSVNVNTHEKDEQDSALTYHTVRFGDTLWDIAKKYNTSIANLKKLNKKQGSSIKPGEKLRVSSN